LVGELLLAVSRPGPHTWIWHHFPGYFAPLWFLGVYTALVVTVPMTVSLHERYGVGVLMGLAGVIALSSVAAGQGVAPAGWVTAGAVGVFAHQLGYAWRGYDLGAARLRTRLAIAGAGLAGLVLLTTVGGYPRSMVSMAGEARSNMFPPTAAIAALAVFQLGLLVLAAPTLTRLLRRPALWKPIVAVNAVAMTIFTWQMTAYLVVVESYEALGGVLVSEPTAGWWAQRWLWLVAPATVMAVIVAALGRLETGRRAAPSRHRPAPARVTGGSSTAAPRRAARSLRAMSSRCRRTT
jgi:hypothetical protein